MTMARKTIVNYPMEVLDFEDIGDLAGRISDDDIVALLVCIDAKNNLKELQLTAGCKNKHLSVKVLYWTILALSYQ